MIRRWFVLGLLCLVIVVLLKNLYKEAIMYNPFHGIEATARAGMNNTKEALPAFEAGWGKEIIDNNLFSPTRSPVQPRSQVQMKGMEAPPKRPEMFLKGIILDTSGEYVAYIEKDKVKAVPVRKGDKLDDVEVIDVNQKNVELKWNEEMISLSLEKIKTVKKPR
jgi:hypothetical protein